LGIGDWAQSPIPNPQIEIYYYILINRIFIYQNNLKMFPIV